MSNDALMPRFLYTMLKQCDLRGIDWNIVSKEMNITNGHAARMRYSRFRQQMEGKASTPRRSKPAKPRKKKGTDAEEDDKSMIKPEDEAGSATVTPVSEHFNRPDNSGVRSPGGEQMSPTQNGTPSMNLEADRAACAERRIKSEPRDDETMADPFAPSVQEIPHSQDADADADADSTFDLASMQAHPDQLLNNHNLNAPSFSPSIHSISHSFGSPGQGSMLTFSPAAAGNVMYSHSHSQVPRALPHSQSQGGDMILQHQHQHPQDAHSHAQHVLERPDFGTYLDMSSYDANIGSHAMGMAMGVGVGVAMPSNGTLSSGGGYAHGGTGAAMIGGHRQSVKLEERWEDNYCI